MLFLKDFAKVNELSSFLKFHCPFSIISFFSAMDEKIKSVIEVIIHVIGYVTYTHSGVGNILNTVAIHTIRNAHTHISVMTADDTERPIPRRTPLPTSMIPHKK